VTLAFFGLKEQTVIAAPKIGKEGSQTPSALQKEHSIWG